MIVNTAKSAPALRYHTAAAGSETKPESSSREPSDSVAFGRLVEDAVLGVIPGVGAYVNLEKSLSAGIAGYPGVSNMYAVGALANVGGTVALAASLFMGNSVLSTIGQLGLGISAATNIYENL